MVSPLVMRCMAAAQPRDSLTNSSGRATFTNATVATCTRSLPLRGCFMGLWLFSMREVKSRILDLPNCLLIGAR